MDKKYTVAIIGCDRLGQYYAKVYQTYAEALEGTLFPHSS